MKLEDGEQSDDLRLSAGGEGLFPGDAESVGFTAEKGGLTCQAQV
jgi:hypothetical protein